MRVKGSKNKIKRCKKCGGFFTINNECECYNTFNMRQKFAKQFPVAAAEKAFEEWIEWCKVIEQTGGLSYFFDKPLFPKLKIVK